MKCNMINKLKTTWKDLDKTVSVNKRELVLGVAACTLAGVVLGVFLSPRKNQTFGSYNGNHNTGRVTALPEDPEEPEKEQEAERETEEA